MTAFLITAAAVAADPTFTDLVWARRFTLETPFTYTMRADRPEITEGVVVQVTLSPETPAESQRVTPLWMAGEWPAMILERSATCAVLVVPDPDALTQPWFVGPAVLASRIDGNATRAERDAAAQRGVSGFDSARIAAVVEPVDVAGVDFRDVAAVGAGRCPRMSPAR